MGTAAPDRSHLYNLLHEALGEEATDALMAFLLPTPSTELVTREMLAATEGRLTGRLDHLEGRFDDLEGRLGDFETRFERLEARVDRLDDRLGRLHTTLIGGFAAMVAALLATGVLN
jgi:hypothetical protein